MSEIAYDDIEWLATWFAGMISSTVKSLPAEDPWRNMSALYVGHDEKRWEHQAKNIPVPEVSGAQTKGRAFGTRRDHTDMIIPEANDWLADLQLAAVAKEIDPWSSALVGFAGGGWQKTRDVVVAMQSAIVAERKTNLDAPTRSMSNVLGEAFRYTVHRRRAYVGFDNEFVWAKGFLWITRSDQILTGRTFTDDDLAADIEESRIPDGDYAQFRLQ